MGNARWVLKKLRVRVIFSRAPATRLGTAPGAVRTGWWVGSGPDTTPSSSALSVGHSASLRFSQSIDVQCSGACVIRPRPEQIDARFAPVSPGGSGSQCAVPSHAGWVGLTIGRWPVGLGDGLHTTDCPGVAWCVMRTRGGHAPGDPVCVRVSARGIRSVHGSGVFGERDLPRPDRLAGVDDRRAQGRAEMSPSARLFLCAHRGITHPDRRPTSRSARSCGSRSRRCSRRGPRSTPSGRASRRGSRRGRACAACPRAR